MSLRKPRRRVNGTDYLYLIIFFLIIFGIIQRIQINSLKKVAQTVKAVGAQITLTPKVEPTIKIEYVEKKDDRGEKLEKYLLMKDSPLASFSSYIINKSDEHGIDYTLMVSISGIESSFGKNTAQACHNPFGIMTYDNGVRRLRCFASWEQAIDYESNLLDKNYRINMANGIQSKYCPPSECNPAWSQTIVDFSREIMEGH